MRNSYSTFINLTKKIFWVISAILIYLIFNSQNLEIYSDNKNFSYNNSQSNDQVIRGAKFFSSDNKNRPFTLTATSAQKKTKSENMYNLMFPSGNLINKNGGYFNIKSEKGTFDQSNEKAHLFDNVVLNDQDGYIFKTESIFINLNSEKVYSNEKISGSGERGNISAQGFEIIDNGNEVRFLGKTKLVILNK